MSESHDDYLKALFKLSEEDSPAGPRRVGTGELARELGLSTGSVSGMLKRLASAQPRLVRYGAHEGAMLTAGGRRHALRVLRRHRLIEQFLEQELGYTWDEVHEEADRLEHAVSDLFTERLSALLGHPVTDPHGELIPTPEGDMPARSERRLADLKPGHAGRVLRVTCVDAAQFLYLGSRGIRPGVELQLQEQEPFGGSYKLRCGKRLIELGPEMAARVYLEDGQ